MEKRRHLTDADSVQMEIEITLDKENGKMIIQDSGIGMTKQELVDLLGTIARSGARF